MTVKLAIVVAIVFLLVFARGWYLRWRAAVRAHRPVHPALPSALVGDADRTWVVFTTPYCASCGPVVERLSNADPDAHVVTVDATREPALADAFSIRSAPTVLLGDRAGNVLRRLVGVESVDAYVSAAYQA